MKHFYLISWFCLSQVLIGQNLVLNPSFEDHKFCPYAIGSFGYNVKQWSLPNMGSTDYFNTCSPNLGSRNYNGTQTPKEGNAYAGFYAFTDKNYREYVQGKLSKTLVKGKLYTMTFYLSLADKSSYALKDLQVLITEEQLKPCHHANRCEKAIAPSKYTKKRFKLFSNSEEKYFSSKTSWMQFTFEFKAEGYETYFSIGNFNRNPKTNKQRKLSDSPYLFSYYYIDDVSITPLEIEAEKSSKTPVIETSKEPLKTNAIYTFKNVLFDFDKAELLAVSIQELKALYAHLKEQPTLNIEIYGHTDNVGLAKRNKVLSEQRAQAVANYLIAQGLDAKRVSAFGFGSSKPITGNDTEANRQLNRRVEFKLIKK